MPSSHWMVQAKLESLSKKPKELHTETGAAAFEALSTKQAAYSKAAGDMAAASEILGEEAAAQVMRSKGPNMKLLQSGHGPNTYDQIWMDTSSGQVYFVEGKGGSAVNSSARKMPDGFHAQQGSAEYHRNLWEARKKDVTARLDALRTEHRGAVGEKKLALQHEIEEIDAWFDPILDAIREGNHEYLMVSQKLEGGGLGQAVEREFITGPQVLQ